MKLLTPIIILATAGCAATYKPPIITDPDTSRSIPGSQSTLLRAAKQVLVTEGYQITNSDESAGVISTAPRDLRLTPELADCGTTMGLDYLKDNRTSAKVAYGVLAFDNKIKLKANMSANYLPGNDTQSITLSCVSRGILENDLLAKIASVAAQ